LQQLAILDSGDKLLTDARAGDQACFERLIEPHMAVAYRLAATMLNDVALAEDALQEATLRAWRSIGQVRASSHIRSWFLTIVANRCRSMRAARWWSVIRLPEAWGTQLSPVDAAVQSEDLARALQRLSPDERAAIFLRFYEDMNSKEVAGALGITASAARSRIRRALRRLRIDLDEEEA
jgi:RNA polymerase sigma-70 factor, ECF subfamily